MVRLSAIKKDFWIPLGFLSKQDGVKWVKEHKINTSDYKTEDELAQAIRDIRKDERALSDLVVMDMHETRPMSDAQLLTMRMYPNSVRKAVEMYDLRPNAFRPVYLQPNIKFFIALTYVMSNSHDVNDIDIVMRNIDFQHIAAYSDDNSPVDNIANINARTLMFTDDVGVKPPAWISMEKMSPDRWNNNIDQYPKLRSWYTLHTNKEIEYITHDPPARGAFPGKEFDDRNTRTVVPIPRYDVNANENLKRLVKTAEDELIRTEPAMNGKVSDHYKRGDIVNCAAPDYESTSDVKRIIATVDIANTIAFSQIEQDYYKDRMISAVLQAVKRSVEWQLNEKQPDLPVHELLKRSGVVISQLKPYLINHPHAFEAFPLLIDDQSRLAYVLNGLYGLDFCQFIMDTYTEEAPQHTFADGTQANCLINCVIAHCGRFLGVRRIAKLVQYAGKPTTIATLEEIARDNKICVVVYDVNCTKWCEYDHTDDKKWTQNNTAKIMVRDNHARIVKTEYRRHANMDVSNVRANQDMYLTHIEHKHDNAEYGKCDYIDNTLVFNDQYALNNVPSGVYYTGDCEPVLEHLLSINIRPLPMIIARKLAVLRFKTHDKRSIEIRRVSEKHMSDTLDQGIPTKYTLSTTTVAMYMFRTFMNEPLYIINDPSISAIFHGLCKPMVNVDVAKMRGHCHIIDVNKAYCSASADLGVFTAPPVIEKCNITSYADALAPGIYLVDGNWMHDFEIAYHCDNNMPIPLPTAMILYHRTTNVFNEFGTSLLDGGYGHFNIRDVSTRKIMYNSLIGALHPNQAELPHSVIISNDVDFGQFANDSNKRITNVTKTTDGKYLVSFVHQDGIVRGKNLPYIASQIIARNNIRIKRVMDALRRTYAADIIGTMTDSIIFRTKMRVDWTKLSNVMTIGKEPGQFSQKYGNEIVAVGPGQYGLFLHVGDKCTTVQLRIQGHERGTHTPELLRHLHEECAKLPYAKKIADPMLDLDVINNQSHLLLIGEAGVGKSRYIKANFRAHGTIRLGSTGMAAASIGGETVHSWFGIGIDMSVPISHILTNMSKRRRNRLINANTIIIDECYGIGCEVMNRIDQIMRAVRGNGKPFGNVRFVFVGDDRQLLSVKDTPYLLTNHGLNITRQTIDYDPTCARLSPEWREQLAPLRKDMTATALRKHISGLKTAKTPFASASTTYYTRADVSAYNTQMIEKAEGEAVMIDDIAYKTGTPIMLTRNGTNAKGSIRNGIYNGALGTFIGYDGETLTVQTDKMHNLKGYTHIVPAYAITIHKMQGQTVDKINIYIRKSQLRSNDATRLLYVALSRVRSSTDVYLELMD